MIDHNLKFYFEGQSFITDFIKENIQHDSVSSEEADVIISNQFPLGIYNKREIQKLISSYKKTDKLVLIVLISDNESVFKIPPNVILYRTSLQKSRKQQNDYLMPYIWECFNESYISLGKKEQPIVGFCGSIKNNLGKRLSTIKEFKKKYTILSNFILRSQFWGGKPNDTVLYEEFKNNILESNFTISNRGRGNFSMRFYQTLSLGRIPILLDSDMLLPFDDEINWENYSIVAKNEKKLVTKVENWWLSKSNVEIIEVEKSCRVLFENYFTPQKLGLKIQDTIVKHKINYKKSSVKKSSFLDKIRLLRK